MSQPPYPSHPGTPPGPPPRSGLSNTGKFWIGVVLTIPAVFVAGFLTSLPSIVLSATGATGGQGAAGAVSLVIGLVLLGVFIAGIVWEPTRYIALGLLAGAAIGLVLAAGACVLLLASFSQSG